jgi:hypothetical protein
MPLAAEFKPFNYGIWAICYPNCAKAAGLVTSKLTGRPQAILGIPTWWVKDANFTLQLCDSAMHCRDYPISLLFENTYDKHKSNFLPFYHFFQVP